MAKWTAEQRAQKANERAAQKAPLLALAGELPTVTAAQVRPASELLATHRATMAAHHALQLQRAAANRLAVASLCWELCAVWDQKAAVIERYGLGPEYIADHWSHAYHDAYGRWPPDMAEYERLMQRVDALRDTWRQQREHERTAQASLPLGGEP